MCLEVASKSFRAKGLYFGVSMCSDIKYRNHLRECPGLNERPLRMSPLFTAEKYNEHPSLMKINEILCFTFCLVWKMIFYLLPTLHFLMSAPA